MALSKEQLEVMLADLDDALVAALPGPEPIKVMVVGGACLVFAGVVDRRTKDIDVIITDFLGAGEVTLVYELDKPLKRLRRTLQTIGAKYGLRGDERMFLNDDCAPFLRELGGVPPVRLLRAYRSCMCISLRISILFWPASCWQQERRTWRIVLRYAGSWMFAHVLLRSGPSIGISQIR